MNFPILQWWLFIIVDFSVKTRFLNSDNYHSFSDKKYKNIKIEQAKDKQTWIRIQDQDYWIVISLFSMNCKNRNRFNVSYVQGVPETPVKEKLITSLTCVFWTPGIYKGISYSGYLLFKLFDNKAGMKMLSSKTYIWLSVIAGNWLIASF